MSAAVIAFRKPDRDHVEIVRVRDVVIEERDGCWWTCRAKPPGSGWCNDSDGEESTTWPIHDLAEGP